MCSPSPLINLSLLLFIFILFYLPCSFRFSPSIIITIPFNIHSSQFFIVFLFIECASSPPPFKSDFSFIGQNVKLSLDCANATFLAFDRLAVSTKTGQVYVVTLLLDGMRAVKGFHFDRAAASVLTTCMTVRTHQN